MKTLVWQEDILGIQTVISDTHSQNSQKQPQQQKTAKTARTAKLFGLVLFGFSLKDNPYLGIPVNKKKAWYPNIMFRLSLSKEHTLHFSTYEVIPIETIPENNNEILNQIWWQLGISSKPWWKEPDKK